MGKGSKPRPVSKNYGNEYDRIFGKRCIKHRRKDCPECSPKTVPCEECDGTGYVSSNDDLFPCGRCAPAAVETTGKLLDLMEALHEARAK